MTILFSETLRLVSELVMINFIDFSLINERLKFNKNLENFHMNFQFEMNEKIPKILKF